MITFLKSSRDLRESSKRDQMIRRLSKRNKEDRISTLPDEIIHHILSFVESNVAVQTCVLSKRWVNLWSTLPFLNFEPHHFDRNGVYYRKFVTDLLSHRNQQSDTCSIKIDFGGFDESVTRMIIDYAISHNGGFDESVTRMIIDYAISHNVEKLVISNATIDACLSFPLLQNLHLSDCVVAPLLNWSMPSLTTLHLEHVTICPWERVMSFEGFNRLKNLTLIGCREFSDVEVVKINSSILKTLTISERYSDIPLTCMFMVSATNLSSFEYQGKCIPTLRAVDGFPLLNQVNLDIDIDKYEWKDYNSEEKKAQVQKIITLFHELQRTKFLELSFRTIQVLSRLSMFSEYQPSPFGNLKSVHLVDSIWNSERLTNSDDHTISYVLSSSPSAKIFIKNCLGVITNYDPRNDMLLWDNCGSPVIKSKVATPSSTKIHVSSEVPHPKVFKSKKNLLRKGQQATSNLHMNGDGMNKVLGVIPHAVVRGALSDKTSSYGEKNGFTLWEGHQIYSEYVDLLMRIKEKHPETFEHFAPQTDIIQTVGLSTLCSIVQAFIEDCRSELTAANISRYRGLFSDLDKWGFNTTWLVNCLSNSDELSFLSRSSHP